MQNECTIGGVDQDHVGLELEDAARIDGVRRALACLSPDADSTHLFGHLSDKQKMYATYFVKHEGDWRKAARQAGYGASATQESIEAGEAMSAYMAALKAEISLKIGLSAATVMSRLNRIALKAEEEKEYPSAIRANIKLGETFGMFHTEATTINVNAEGVIIQIGKPRDVSDDVIDAEYQEILERNGVPRPPLPAEAG